MADQEAEEPSALHREIKGLLEDFRRSLTTADPWHREIEHQRNNIRRRIVHLLFEFPYSQNAKLVEVPLWHELTHAIINIYRQRLEALHQSVTAPGAVRPIVQIRKLENRFRSFLSTEESFWSELALRTARTYDLHEATAALGTLGLTLRGRRADSREDMVCDPWAEDSNSHANRGAIKHPSLTQRHRKVMLVYKVLLYLGDLARYREQSNTAGAHLQTVTMSHPEESNSRKERGGKKSGQGARGTRLNDYSRSMTLYNRARMMLPDVGNASNQLAVLSISNGDSFTAVYHCFRALCVRRPFPTASDNLEKTLTKVVQNRRSGPNLARETISDNFKSEAVYLHSLWLLKPDSLSLQKQSERVLMSLESLVKARSLSSDVIAKMLVMSFAALWHVRMFTQSLPGSTAQATQLQCTAKVTSSNHSEPHILAHVLGIFRILMVVGVREMGEVELRGANPGDKNEHQKLEIHSLDLAQRITATFRRTLPSLRLASKWLKGSVEYIERCSPKCLGDFWSTYSAFLNTLAKTFNAGSLPPLTIPLEEDIDMKAFAPLEGSFLKGDASGQTRDAATFTETIPDTGLHPNEEYLMRISDLLRDGESLCCAAAFPVSHRDGIFSFPNTLQPIPFSVLEDGQAFKPPGTEPQELLRSCQPPLDVGNHGRDADDEDIVTVSTRTDDDPVNLAMRATLDSEDDEDEMILYPVRSRVPDETILGNCGLPHQLRTASPKLKVTTGEKLSAAQHVTTAEDLLQEALRGGKEYRSESQLSNPLAPNDARPPVPLAARSALLTTPPQTTSAPMLFGASDSMWGLTLPGTSQLPHEGRATRQSLGQLTHTYSLSQSQIGLSHQLWNPPHQIFNSGAAQKPSDLTGLFSDVASGEGYTKPIATPPKASALPFNPVVGSPPQSRAQRDQTQLDTPRWPSQGTSVPMASFGPFDAEVRSWRNTGT